MQPFFWYIRCGSQERITLALSRYLRSLSDIDSEYITLRKELELVADYAEIQRFRYTDFTITTDVSIELLDVKIHKLMIVNLVENSIIHGIADNDEPGIITIKVRLEEKILFITVSDNGIGLPDEALSILEEESTGEGNHTGLRNIQDRLRLYHGSDCSLIIDSKAGCSITIPLPIDTGG